MATKRYNEQNFSATINGVEYSFSCYTTDTRNGFCHTCVSNTLDITNTKCSYCNRTWESFRYETVLLYALDKISPKSLRDALKVAIVDKTNDEVHERCERFNKRFEETYKSLNEDTKKRLAESNIEVHNEEQADALLGAMMLAKALGA